MTRYIFLDTETTGMNKLGPHYNGHRIIEIGAVEVINRCITGNYFHVYLNPQRIIDPKAFRVHNISDEFLIDKPIFANVVDEFLNFVKNSNLVIHNAPFDIGFINYELGMLKNNFSKIDIICNVIDSLYLARKIFPGKRNSLDALIDRYSINKRNRIIHSALLDAEILADIFLLMTSKQLSMSLYIKEKQKYYELNDKNQNKRIHSNLENKIITATTEENLSHEQYLDYITRYNGYCLWNALNENN